LLLITSRFDCQSVICSDRVIAVVFTLRAASIPLWPKSLSDDGDPMLSADGCELYFSSTRTGGDYDLYVAQITR
jgi:hypothetical protein